MSDPAEHAVAAHLDELREPLVHAVAVALAAGLPMITSPAEAEDRAGIHREHMAATARRFHDMVQMGATLRWELVAEEYAWAQRVLGLRGITWDHQTTLIDAYFTSALGLRAWSDAERAVLDQLAARLRAIGAAAFGQPAS